jgi:hypothetical protein
VPDRQDQSDLLAAQLATLGAALAFFLAACGLLAMNYGFAIGFLIGAIALWVAAHYFPKLALLKFQWPLVLADERQREYWSVFRFASYAAVISSVILSAIFGSIFYIFELRSELRRSEARQEIRHLTSDQKERLRKGMQLNADENYSFQLNTVPSCDECEQFAEELRAFINTIPGWKTAGAPLIFPLQVPRRGLWIVSREQDHLAAVDKLNKAFGDAGLPLTRSNEEVQPGTFLILIGRPGA